MSTATLPPPTTGRVADATSRQAAAPLPNAAAGDGSAARAFLLRYTVMLLSLAAALVAVQAGAQLLPEGAGTLGWGWPMSIAAGWALAVAAWLRRRGWATGTLVAVGAGPAAALAIPAAAGWLSPAGLLLWGPVSTLLAVALALVAQPLPSPARALPNWLPASDHGAHTAATSASPRTPPAIEDRTRAAIWGGVAGESERAVADPAAPGPPCAARSALGLSASRATRPNALRNPRTLRR